MSTGNSRIIESPDGKKKKIMAFWYKICLLITCAFLTWRGHLEKNDFSRQCRIGIEFKWFLSVEPWAISPSLAHPHPSIDRPKITAEISPQNHCIPSTNMHQLGPLGHLGRGWPSHEKLKRRGGPPGLTAGGMNVWFMCVGSIICPIKYSYIMLYHMYIYI